LFKIVIERSRPRLDCTDNQKIGHRHTPISRARLKAMKM
jgi:hypothetical protein